MRFVRAPLSLQNALYPSGACVLATEIFGWRQIRNGRELGALVGLVPAPCQSGETSYDLGITRAGNKHERRVMVQLAWSWLRYQPHSALAQWYQRRFGDGGRRMRRIGIVALARKLLIARAVGGNCKFPICGNRKPHTLVVGGGCPAFHDVDDVNNEGAGHRCMDGRRGCC